MRLRILCVACMAAFALLAVSTPAQDQATQDQASEFVNRLRPPKPAGSAGSAAKQSQEEHTRKSNQVGSDATETCSYKFTSGSGATYMAYCVSVNGTLENFESPAGIEMLDQNGSYEGYGVCDATGAGTAYWDYNYADSGNWNAPTLATHTATEVKIERSTSDGNWLLTQTITKVSGATPAAKIAMALKNTSGVSRQVLLLRFGGFVPDKAASDGFYENYDGSNDGAWGYIPKVNGYSVSDPYGLMLQNVGTPVPLSGLSFAWGYGYNSFFGPNPCYPISFDTDGDYIVAGTQTNSESAGAYLYLFTLNKNQIATVNLRYFSF